MLNFVLFFCLLTIISADDNSTTDYERNIHFIKDFIAASNAPIVVTALLCWKFGNLKENLFALMIDELIALRRALPFTMMRTPSLDQDWQNIVGSEKMQQYEVFILDVTCPETPDIIIKAGDNQLFSFPYTWLLLNSISHDSVVESLRSFAVLPDSNIIIAETRTTDYSLYQVFKPSTLDSLIHEPYGNWNEDQGIIDVRTSPINSRRRRDLLGSKITLSLVITNNDSMNHLDDYRDKHIDTITKLSYKLSNHLMDTVNATKFYTRVPSWGYKDPKAPGGWNGMLGELHRGEADIGTPLFFTVDRIPVIEYISMTTPTQARFVFRAPPLSYVSNLYLLPFGRGVWIACGVLIASMVLALSITSKWELEQKSSIIFAISDSLLLSLGAVCQQGPPVTPRNPAGRIVSLFLFVAVMFLYTSYTANIVSLLQARTYSIRTLKDLLHSPLKFGVDDTVYNHYYFSTATEPVRKAIYEQKVAPKGKKPRFMKIDEGVHKMRQGLFAFHMERGSGYKLVSETFFEDEKCGLIEIDYLTFIDPWMPVRKRSPYKEIFKVNMFKIRESGVQAREVSRHYTKKPTCTTGGASFVSVGLADCYSGGFVLSLGGLISISLLVIEKLWPKHRPLVAEHESETAASETVDINEPDIDYSEFLN